MNASKANLINSISLIGFGLWGYFEVTSPTALIPVGFGLILLFEQNSDNSLTLSMLVTSHFFV